MVHESRNWTIRRQHTPTEPKPKRRRRTVGPAPRMVLTPGTIWIKPAWDCDAFALELHAGALIKTVKAQIQDQTGMPVDQQRLILKGKLLGDGCSFRSYYTDDDEPITLTLAWPELACPSLQIYCAS